MTPIVFVDPFGLDSYYFVGPDQAGCAEKDAKYLEEFYGTPVHIIYVKNEQEFLDAWNMMGNWEGQDVTVECAVINMHGNSEGIAVNSTDKNIDLSKMKSKYVDDIILITCSGGNVNTENNPAVQLLSQNNVNSVTASDDIEFYYYNYGEDHRYGYEVKSNDSVGFVRYRVNDNGDIVYDVTGKSFSTALDIMTLKVLDLICIIRG